MLASAMREQHVAIVHALVGLAAELRFDEHAAALAGDTSHWPDVLRMRRTSGRAFLFVGHARAFGEPADDPRQQVALKRWLRRFARLADERRRARIYGGYVVVGTHDAPAAYAWASQLTSIARTYRIRRDGEPARFIVRKLGDFWMAV